jgi:RNA polymerase sigma-70 factor (ECF subfamily)
VQRETLRTELNLQLLYQRLLPTVYRAAYTFMKNSFDSEDAAQEAFIRLAVCSRSFEDERAVKGWLIVTVSNICRDMLRRKHREDLNVDDYPELPAPESGGEDLLALLLDLPEKFKTSIYLYYYEGYAVGEIARAMGQSEGTVKSWLHRGRKLLKRLLEEER